MSDGRGAEAQLDALMYRMLGGLLLLGAAVLLGLVLALFALPHAGTGRAAVILLPGGHALSALALLVLGAGTLLLGLPGLVALGLARRQVRFARPVGPTMAPRSRRRPALILLGGLAVLAIVLLRR